ncbi:exported hypothetical protein [Nostocoides japonicum T1-X7]|uniref:Cache domain-containing protein n=1 Tax=Nostocoides japonicum T1-X7 TaxID=1194083 RepID=A0A077LUU3_9MICO|nr:cache domain-containing protein [Tetrasphaera japonica]CCH77658.1 exported hypothetical protein [Tetrasphaera japonica T1-X7]
MRTTERRDLLVATVDALGTVLSGLSALAAEAAGLWRGGPPPVADLATLRHPIGMMLSDHADLIVGAGIAVGPDRLADADRHLEWWWARPGGGLESLRVNLDPSAPDFYDFAGEEWFAGPEATLDPCVAGPYVDYACTNDYALTVAHPVVQRGRMVAVAAADLPVASLEARTLPALAPGAPRGVLVNASGRVVLSTVADLLPGERVDDRLAPSRSTAAPAPIPGWRLHELDA